MPTAFQRAFKRGKQNYYARRGTTKKFTAYKTTLPKAANAVVTVPRPRPFPAYTDCVLRYVELFNVDPVAGLASNYFFSANSIYDPNVTAAGNQPLGYDEYQNIYNQYRVLKAKMKLYAAPTGSTTTSQVIVGVRTVPDTTIQTNVTEMMEAPNSKFMILSDDEKVKSVTCYWNIQSLGSYVDESDLNSLTTGNPAQREYFGIYVHGMDGNIDPATVKMVCMIEYTVRWFDPRSLTKS